MLTVQTISLKETCTFHIFLSGSGGTGKSHTIKAIYHTVNESFASAGSESSDTHVILTAPTGTAAFNIEGTTVHAALGLSSIDRRKKVNQTTAISTETGSHFLSQEKKNMLRNKLKNLKIIIIDEISMVGANTFVNIHKSLHDIMGLGSANSVFGGVYVLAVGDLLQLPPVGELPVFSSTNYKQVNCYGSLWKRHFKLIKLTI